MFRMVVDIDHIQIKFEYQSHWVKATVIERKLILVPGHHFHLLLSFNLLIR